MSSIALISTLSIHRKHKESTEGIINHDSLMRKFVYKVYLTRNEIIGILLSVCSGDKLVCKFDSDLSTMVFSDILNSEAYYLVTEKQGDFSILKLERIAGHSKSQIKYKLNPFIVSKLKAEALPFSEYEF